jgi:hypothetical protein
MRQIALEPHLGANSPRIIMMRVLLFFLVLALTAVRTAAQLPPWSDDARKAWWVANPTLQQQVAAMGVLRRDLAQDYKKNGAAAFSQPDFRAWLDHVEWIQLGVDAHNLLAKPGNMDTFIALGNDDRLSHQLVEKMEPRDDKTAALAILLRLAQANMADLHEYAALGIAYSLVFDVPFPDDWPHAQVARSAVPIGDLDPVARFQFYVGANRAHQLDLDISQQSFENLKFVVDDELKLSELSYGQGDSTPYSHFADAFFSIKYDTLRVDGGNGVFDWNLKSYALAEIKAAGGICIDQAYYACMVGKARGIPTVMLTGLGDEGAHAWLGYLDRSGAWQLDCGRYEEQNFAKGYTRDPQTWEELKDTDLVQYVKNGVKDPNYPAARAALMWARLQGDTPAARGPYDDARAIMPNLAQAWRAEADYLDRTNVSLDDQKTFYQSWISQVAPYPDQKVDAQRRLVGALRKGNDSSADSVEQDIILQNRTGGIDLAVQGTLEEIDDHFKARDWDGARMEFERSVRDFGDKGGGTFFFNLMEPYVYDCWTKGQAVQAGEAIRFADDRTPLDKPAWNGPTTISSGFDTLKSDQAEIEVGLAKMQAWLGEIDSGQADQAWSEAGPALQAEEASDKWTAEMDKSRQKIGSVTSRTLTAVGHHERWQTPDGKMISGTFVAARFMTVGDAGSIEETVCFQKTGERTWQAYAYECKPVLASDATATTSTH